MEFCEGITIIHRRGGSVISYQKKKVRKVNSIFSWENDLELVYLIALCTSIYTHKENIT